jgi:nitrite reductase/ring-hydroxylating ferredoxin subunit
MVEGTPIVAIDEVPDAGSYLFTVEDAFTNEREAILVPCEADPGVEAWINSCTHEAQRFDRGDGVAMRDGQLICPKHGSMFDVCSGECDNGKAAGTMLPGLDIAVADGEIYLVDENYTFLQAGGIDDDSGPSSSSHLSF